MNKWYHNPKLWVDKWELKKPCSDCEERVEDYKRYAQKGLNDRDDEAHKLRSSHFCFEHCWENPLKLKADEKEKVKGVVWSKIVVLFFSVVVGLLGASCLIDVVRKQTISSKLCNLGGFLVFLVVLGFLVYYLFKGDKSDNKELAEIRDQLRQWRKKETDEDFKKGQCKLCQKEGKKWFCEDCPFNKEWKWKHKGKIVKE